MLRFRIRNLLHQDSKLFIVSVDLAEVGSVGWVDNVGRESSSQRIVDLDSNIVDRCLRIFMEVFVNSDGVRELDRR